jgi:hypothetical protein
MRSHEDVPRPKPVKRTDDVIEPPGPAEKRPDVIEPPHEKGTNAAPKRTK